MSNGQLLQEVLEEDLPLKCKSTSMTLSSEHPLQVVLDVEVPYTQCTNGKNFCDKTCQIY